MKRRWQVLSAVVAVVVSASAIAASKGEFATADEAQAMVKKGVAFIKSSGKDKGYAEITNKKGQFTDRDLYLVVYGLDGVVRAQVLHARRPDRGLRHGELIANGQIPVLALIGRHNMGGWGGRFRLARVEHISLFLRQGGPRQKGQDGRATTEWAH